MASQDNLRGVDVLQSKLINTIMQGTSATGDDRDVDIPQSSTNHHFVERARGGYNPVGF